jgi:hypothetical protein
MEAKQTVTINVKALSNGLSSHRSQLSIHQQEIEDAITQKTNQEATPKTPYEKLLYNTLQSLNCPFHECQEAVLHYRADIAQGKTAEKPQKESNRHRLWHASFGRSTKDCLIGKNKNE